MILLDVIPISELVVKPIKSGGSKIFKSADFPVRRQVSIAVFNDSATVSFNIQQGE